MFSYIACAGLPEPMADHALHMADFALDIIDGMEKLKLVMKKKGIDIDNIGVRVGLHSGSVIAGVVGRGKSLFQIFGRTVYTANHMETTGKSGAVHISDATAALLKAGGCKHFIFPRNETIKDWNHETMLSFWLSRQVTVDCSDLQVNTMFKDKSKTFERESKLDDELDHHNHDKFISSHQSSDRLLITDSFLGSKNAWI